MRQHRCSYTRFEPFEREDIEQSIIERFALQVDRHSGCLAIGDGQSRIDYGSLERWTRVIAGRLVDARVAPGTRVVLLLEQGAASIAATLGVLRAAAVYVPLDPAEPDPRLQSALEQVEPSALVTDAHGAARLGRLVPDLPAVLADDDGSSPDVPMSATSPDAPAYIYFTSGSTGRPKGVVDAHRNVLHNVMRYVNALHIGPGDRLSLLQAPAFSGVVSSMFAALMSGAAVFPYRLDRDSLGDVAGWLRAERITIYHSVPSILRAALASADTLPDIRVVRLEGDRSHGQDMATWHGHLAPGTLLANGLGITETGLCRQLIISVDSQPADGILPVGYPVPDMEVSVIDEAGQALDIGAVGEITVSSPYLALGYWRDDHLTAGAFGDTDGRAGWRTYRTGDLGRLRPDGCLEYLGRRDGLSKVLGHRVEPAEVEAALASIEGVRSVAVRIDADDRGAGRVIAYVVGPTAPDLPRLRSAAAEHLPPHMRPARFVILDDLPLGPNGKVDRAALPDSDPAGADSEDQPADPLEATIAVVIAEVLGHPIERTDDFFESGGDSLAAVDAALALARALDRDLPPSVVVRAPTVADLAAEVRTADEHRALAYPLFTRGTGTPLVVVPSHVGHATAFALLARHLAPAHPIWALESDVLPGAAGEEVSVEAIASRHAESLRRSAIDGPSALVGFCYGGVVAFEMARQLLEAGVDVAGVCLLGVSPYDFPGLTPPEALERWMDSRGRLGMTRRAIRYGRGALSAPGRSYVADRLRSRSGRVRSWLAPRARARRRLRAREAAALRPTFGQYRSEPLPVPVTVIVPAWSLDLYGGDPREIFSHLSPRVQVHVVPGAERMMLSEPVVSTVATLMADDARGAIIG